MSIKNNDLKRKVRYKVRKKKTLAYKIEYDYLQNRKYQDFIDIFQNNPNISLWQIDTVEGTKGVNEPGILTLLHVKSNLQLLFYLETIN